MREQRVPAGLVTPACGHNKRLGNRFHHHPVHVRLGVCVCVCASVKGKKWLFMGECLNWSEVGTW